VIQDGSSFALKHTLCGAFPRASRTLRPFVSREDRSSCGDDALVHGSAAHAVLAGPGGAALSIPVANRTLFQGVEVVREPAHVRHREPAHRRGPDLGEPVRRGAQALPRPCCATRRPGDGDVDASRRHVRASHPRRPRRRGAPRCRSLRDPPSALLPGWRVSQ
jgi:hypothetical protein